jgi:hypothetical protein
MALDWIAGHRAQPGHEAEFQEIVAALFADRLGSADRAAASAPARNRLLRLFFGRAPTVRPASQALRQRYDEIGIKASETLGGLRIGPEAGDGCAEQPLSFCAEGLTATTMIIGDHLLRACYEVKFAPDLAAFGRAFLVRAGAFAKAKGFSVPEMTPTDPASPEGQLQNVRAAGQWCLFWGERGHFLEPRF